MHHLFRTLSTLLVVQATATSSSSLSFTPSVGASWNIELIHVPKPAQADNASYHIWDFDMAEAPHSTIDAFHDQDHKVMCYFSAGTWENWRKDADEFPQVALGRTLGHWPNEKWLNTSNAGVREIMVRRIKDAAAKKCDGVDPDNIDGYENDTGFNLTKDEGVDYVRFLAQTAHDHGLAYGLKNGGAIVPRVVDVAQWCINEQCVQYDECELYQPFIKHGKPVFHIEYTKDDPAPPAFVKKSCENAHAKGFSTLIKHLSLNAWTTVCP